MPARASRPRLAAAIALALALPPQWAAGPASAQRVSEGSLPVEGSLDAASGTLTLGWPQAERQIVGSVTVSRRPLGREGPTSWEPLGPPRATAVWRDPEVATGRAFEYQVVRRQRGIVDAGYWIAGLEVPARAERGTALLLVDEEVEEGIPLHLERFRRDLVGAGWRVVARPVPRHRGSSALDFDAALAIRDWIADRVAGDPGAEHAVILVGHVPIPRAGRSAPDGHAPRPHPTDAFYADVDGEWAVGLAGGLLNDVVPGNGIELQVGRIDFAPVARGDRAREIRLLQQYLDKNHHWRHGLLGDLRAAYAGDRGRLAVEADGLLNLVGPGAVVAGGHHGAGAEGAWLWGVDFGSWKTEDYFEATGGGSGRSVFAVNFGSHKQIFDADGNAMTALLAQPWHTVAVGWGGRPSWRLHLMALGGTIGEVHRRTLNNGSPDGSYPLGFEYVPTGQYVFRQPVWVNLLGDPTLHAYPLAPPRDPVLRREGAGALLSWHPAEDGETLGHRVYRLVEDGARGEPVGDGEPVAASGARLGAAAEAGRHFVRAHGLKRTPAGSFHAYSQGSYVVAADRPLPDVVTVAAAPGEGGALFVPATRRLGGRDHLVSILRPPRTGRIEPVPGGWLYAPSREDPDLSLPVTVFDGEASRPATLEIVPR